MKMGLHIACAAVLGLLACVQTPPLSGTLASRPVSYAEDSYSRYMQAGQRALAAGESAIAVKHFLTTVELSENFAADDSRHALALYHAAKAFSLEGNLSRAQEYLNRARAAAAKLENASGQQGEIEQLAGVLFQQHGEHARAIDPLERALAIYRSTAEANLPRPDSATLEERHAAAESTLAAGQTAAALAHSHHVLGNNERAEALYLESVSLYEAYDRNDHRPLIAALNSLGSLYIAAGLYDKAEIVLERALWLGNTNHPGSYEVGETLNTLGALYARLEKFDEAEALHRNALNIWRHSPHASPADIASATQQLGDVFAARRAFFEARDHYREALKLRLETLGEQHPAVAGTHYALASVAEQEQVWGEAQRQYEKALAIYEKHTDEQASERTAQTLAGLARVHKEQGDRAAAARFMERALHLSETAGDTDAPSAQAYRAQLASLRERATVPETAAPAAPTPAEQPSQADQASAASNSKTEPDRTDEPARRERFEFAEQLVQIQDLLFEAHFHEALDRIDTQRAKLPAASEGTTGDTQRARTYRGQLEVFAATAHLALQDEAAARRSLKRALASDPELELNQALTSPKVRKLFESIKSKDAQDAASE